MSVTLGVLTLLASLCDASSAHAHAVLVPGDVIVVGIVTSDGVSPGTITVALLNTLHVDGAVGFTDDGLGSDERFRVAEGRSILEAVRMPIPRGTVVEIDTGTLSLGGRDQVAIYEGVIQPTGELLGGRLTFQATWGGPFVATASSDSTSALSATLGLASIELAMSGQAFEYVGRTSGTRVQILTQVHDPAFWRVTSRALFSPPTSFTVTPVRGEACASTSECAAGFLCVDDVCCESACGGGNPTDCMTCNFGLVPETGTCGIEPPSHICREAAGYCDIPETCDGVASTCPSDQIVPGGFVCRPVRDVCDIEELCDGVTVNCPLDAFAGPERVCREAVDACDVEERCAMALRCPMDVLGCFDAGPVLPDAGLDAALDRDAPAVERFDAGAVDGGAVDGGPLDATVILDATSSPDVEGPNPPAGCACSSARGGDFSPWMGLMLAAWASLRRR